MTERLAHAQNGMKMRPGPKIQTGRSTVDLTARAAHSYPPPPQRVGLVETSCYPVKGGYGHSAVLDELINKIYVCGGYVSLRSAPAPSPSCAPLPPTSPSPPPAPSPTPPLPLPSTSVAQLSAQLYAFNHLKTEWEVRVASPSAR